MKINFSENDQCFHVSMIAEDMKDAALLTRFGMNHTAEIRHCAATANRDGGFEASIVFGKSRRANNYIPKRK